MTYDEWNRQETKRITERELMVARDTLDRLEDALREESEFVDRERLLSAWRVTSDCEYELTRKMEGES